MAPPPPPDLTRRHVIYGSAGMAAAGLFPSTPFSSPAGDRQESEKRSAVLIGRLDSEEKVNDCLDAFDRFPGFAIAALADADEASHEAARARLGASRTYAEYRIMLGAEEPDLAIIGSGLGEDRHAAILAALEVGAHVFVDGPMPGTLAETDEIGTLARENKRKVGISSPFRFHPVIREFAEQAGELIGDLIEVRVFGKMDGESAGRDLMENGVPLFEIARLAAGEPETCDAVIRQNGQPAIFDDIRDSAVGDDLFAHFHLTGGAHLNFVSRPAFRAASGGPGIEWIGSKTVARLFTDPEPAISILQNPAPANPNRGELWRSWPAESSLAEEETENRTSAPRNAFEDWLDAIQNDRDPLVSIVEASRSLEMAHAVFQSGLRHEPATFPLAARAHPLAMA